MPPATVDPQTVVRIYKCMVYPMWGIIRCCYLLPIYIYIYIYIYILGTRSNCGDRMTINH